MNKPINNNPQYIQSVAIDDANIEKQQNINNQKYSFCNKSVTPHDYSQLNSKFQYQN